MVFHLARLVEWRHPSLTAPAWPGGEAAADLVRAACPACGLGYLASGSDAADERARSRMTGAAAAQLGDECPDHAAQFAVNA